jgi:hypothetical protein
MVLKPNIMDQVSKKTNEPTHLGAQPDGSFAFADGVFKESIFIPAPASEQVIREISHKLKNGNHVIVGHRGQDISKNIN